ncbi:ADP-ribosylglycohydrolase family protein [Candidatus Woesearchaeota archaeon]|nr:ADP-ribosylglycohydrolase family protein [Candidatus Woesearchaeota archaeon]
MTKEKYLGCIYGLAIGDALGYPNEFIRFPYLLRKNKGRGTIDFEPSRVPAGTYTDDTQMSLAIARALLKSDLSAYSLEPLEEIMENISDEFVKWLRDPENNRAPGNTCIAGCKKLEQGVHWKDSGDPKSKGCGTAMRTAPIGLMFADDLSTLTEVAHYSSKCTHAHPTGIAAGIATAYLTALALKDIDHNAWIDNLLEFPSLKENEEFTDKIRQVKQVLPYEDHFQALKELGDGWVGEQAVALALYCVLKNPQDYEKTVLMGANTNGDSDSIACIAGAISGAYNGIESIPERWIEKVENTQYLREIAEALYEKRHGEN